MLRKAQKIYTILSKSQNSDLSFTMTIYEENFQNSIFKLSGNSQSIMVYNDLLQFWGGGAGSDLRFSLFKGLRMAVILIDFQNFRMCFVTLWQNPRTRSEPACIHYFFCSLPSSQSSWMTHSFLFPRVLLLSLWWRTGSSNRKCSLILLSANGISPCILSKSNRSP